MNWLKQGSKPSMWRYGVLQRAFKNYYPYKS